jgi:hypothetical protein
VLQLVDEHRLRLGDTVERWLPGLVPGQSFHLSRDSLLAVSLGWRSFDP